MTTPTDRLTPGIKQPKCVPDSPEVAKLRGRLRVLVSNLDQEARKHG
jgi:hypothetical protein